MSTLKKLEEARIVAFELNKTKDVVSIGRLCDYYYEAYLSRSEITELIDELTQMRDEMVNQ